MAKIVTLFEAISETVVDGGVIALEGFTHLIPFAAGHEIIRQNKCDLKLIRMTPDIIYDQMIGMGCASSIVFSWVGNPGVGSLHRFRDAIENDWPKRLSIQEYSHASMACAYEAGASGLPFGLMRGYQGVDLPKFNHSIKQVTCPFTGEELSAVPAIRPDVSIVHAQKADREGNVLFTGIVGVQKEIILAAKFSVVTVEEIVESLDAEANAVIVPGWAIDFVVEASYGAYPSYAFGYYQRDNEFYVRWDKISRDRKMFLDWMKENVINNKGYNDKLVL